jgi:hypothetical protein
VFSAAIACRPAVCFEKKVTDSPGRALRGAAGRDRARHGVGPPGDDDRTAGRASVGLSGVSPDPLRLSFTQHGPDQVAGTVNDVH